VAVILGQIQCNPFLQIFQGRPDGQEPPVTLAHQPNQWPLTGAPALRQDYLTDAAEPSGTAGAKPHGAPRSDAATIPCRRRQQEGQEGLRPLKLCRRRPFGHRFREKTRQPDQHTEEAQHHCFQCRRQSGKNPNEKAEASGNLKGSGEVGDPLGREATPAPLTPCTMRRRNARRRTPRRPRQKEPAPRVACGRRSSQSLRGAACWRRSRA